MDASTAMLDIIDDVMRRLSGSSEILRALAATPDAEGRIGDAMGTVADVVERCAEDLEKSCQSA